MRLLFDQGTPVPLRQHLIGHRVSTAFGLGWASLDNGQLLQQAQAAGVEVVIPSFSGLGSNSPQQLVPVRQQRS